MPQENASLDLNAEFGITVDERGRFNDFLFARYVNEKLTEAETLVAANPNAWIDADDFLAEWEHDDKKDGIYAS
jgi:hypothetical protein